MVNECADECLTEFNGGTITGDQMGCGPSFDPSAITSVSAASGYPCDSVEYQWMVSNTDPSGAFSQWVMVPGATGLSYDPPALTAPKTYYQRCVRCVGCTTFITETNYITIMVNECNPCDDITNGGQIAANQTSCQPFDPQPITNVILPTGGSGEIEYLWVYTTDNPFGGGNVIWYPISGTNSPNYDPGFLSQTTYFRRCVRRSGCPEFIKESNIITISIQPNPITVTVNATGTIPCNGDVGVNLNATVTGGSGSYAYSWSNDATTQNINNLPHGMYGVTVTDGGGCGTATAWVMINEPDVLSCSATITAQPTCGNSNGSATISATGGTAPYSFHWSNNTTTPTLTNVGEGTYSITVTDANGCSCVSSVVLTTQRFSIGNFVWNDINQNGIQDNGEQGMDNIGVKLVNVGTDGIAGTNDDTILSTQLTHNGGQYLFENLCAGKYAVQFSQLPNNFVFTTENQGGNDDADSDAGASGYSHVIMLMNANITNVDAGIHLNPCTPLTSGGSIGLNQIGCLPSLNPNPFTSISPAAGCTNINYQWYANTSAADAPFSQWTAIAGATSTTYDAPLISTTTHYRRYAKCANCTEFSISSNTVSVLLKPCDEGLVQFNNFNIAKLTNDNRVKIEWETSGDTNDNVFLIESSRDGISFQLIARVNGQPRNIGGNYYISYDESPKVGKNFYRVRHVSSDNQILTTEIKSLTIQSPAALDMNIYPNPIIAEVTFEPINEKINTDIQVTIIDALGRPIQSLLIPRGTLRTTLDMSNLKDGVYFVQMKYNDFITKTQRLIKASE